MNEEEKKAIEILKEFRDYYSREDIYRENFNSNESYKKALNEIKQLKNNFDIILNLIKKIQKEYITKIDGFEGERTGGFESTDIENHIPRID